MTDRKKRNIRFTLPPSIQIIDEESRSFWSRSALRVEQVLVTQEKPLVSSPRTPKRVSYVPPDTLMFPLFSAIQRKAWTQAKRLCHELILCNPDRKMYQDLYVRLDQITSLINRQRHHQQSDSSRTTTASSDSGRSSHQRPQ